MPNTDTYTKTIISRFLNNFGKHLSSIDTTTFRFETIKKNVFDIPVYDLMVYEMNHIKSLIARDHIDRAIAAEIINDYFRHASPANTSKKSIHMSRLPDIQKLIYNGDTTIVIWGDGTKTIVRCSDNDNYDREKALMMCMMERMFGSKTKLKNFLNEACLYDKYPLPEEMKDPTEEFARIASSMSCAKLAEVLGLSESTIRRGRKKLEEQA